MLMSRITKQSEQKLKSLAEVGHQKGIPFMMFSVMVSLYVGFLTFAKTSYASDKAKALYKMCAKCHGHNGEGVQGIGAPTIHGLPEWYLTTQLVKFRDGIRAGHPKDLYGHKMRPMARALSDDDIKIVSAYVSAKPRKKSPETITGSVVKGEGKFQVCVACHGAKGGGNQALSAPPIAGLNDWYLLRQLHNFKGKLRGANPAVDVAGSQMQGISNALNDEDMINVVSYINTLPVETGP